MHFYTCLEDCRILSEPFSAHFWCINWCTNLCTINECRSFHINLHAISFISELNLSNLHVKVAVHWWGNAVEDVLNYCATELAQCYHIRYQKPRELGLAACRRRSALWVALLMLWLGNSHDAPASLFAQISDVLTKLLFISSYTANNSEMHHICMIALHRQRWLIFGLFL